MESTPPDTPLVEGDHSSRSDKEKSNKSKKRRRAGLEASHLHGTSPAPEHIGSVLVSAAETGQEKTAGLSSEKHIETLDRAELLELSERIKVNSSTLRQIYETHLIGEHGLRRLVAEYMHDGDLRAALRHEIVEHEIDFERDPQMRDLNLAQPSDNGVDGGGSNDSGKAALDELLKRVAIDADEDGESVRQQRQKTGSAKADIIQEINQAHKRQFRRRVMNIGLIGLIIVLLVLVIALYVKQG